MKEINELILPEDVRYTKDHEWARTEGDKVRIGITDYAQDRLGDIVFVEVSEVGASIKKGEQCGTLESVKAVSEVFMPVGGQIVSINTSLKESPELVNANPYGDGWMAEVKPENPNEIDDLMSGDAYLEMLKGMIE
ncbi:MAG: glycine cleavage system protein GcvH [Syntrophobacteraceae bacterium]